MPCIRIKDNVNSITRDRLADVFLPYLAQWIKITLGMFGWMNTELHMNVFACVVLTETDNLTLNFFKIPSEIVIEFERKK